MGGKRSRRIKRRRNLTRPLPLSLLGKHHIYSALTVGQHRLALCNQDVAMLGVLLMCQSVRYFIDHFHDVFIYVHNFFLARAHCAGEGCEP
jgi:hypothetical protein